MATAEEYLALDRVAEYRSELVPIFAFAFLLACTRCSLEFSQQIEQYTRGQAHTWTLRDYQATSETLRIECLGVSLPVARIYERIELPPE